MISCVDMILLCSLLVFAIQGLNIILQRLLNTELKFLNFLSTRRFGPMIFHFPSNLETL